MTYLFPVPIPVYPYPIQSTSPALQVPPAALLTGTLVIASALSIGSNLVDVQNGSMTLRKAVVNGAAKGIAATVIINATSSNTATEIIMTAGIPATAGYLIDSAMNTDRGIPCTLPEKTAV